MNHLKLRALCEGAVLVAVAEILSFIKLWEMPWGGSVVLSMVPLVLYAVRWGLGPGLLSGFVFGVLQFVLSATICWRLRCWALPVWRPVRKVAFSPVR